MNTELQLAELYVNTVVKNVGKSRTHHPTDKDIEHAKSKAIADVEKIIGKKLDVI